MLKRHRSTSPNVPITARQAINAAALKQRRSSWQANRDRKTAAQLEAECDEDDGDDVPDEYFLDNVPISPRPPQERPKSRPTSTGTSPERNPEKKVKERIRSVGNGTAPVPAEQGELRSPRTPNSPKPGVINRGTSMGQFPINHNTMNPKGRPMSWVSALSELSEEAKALTEALEAHADEEENKDPVYQKSPRPEKPRVRSAIAELPPGSQLNGEELKKKRWLDKIELDVESTYPDLRIFQAGGPLHDSLLDVLKAYAMYRSDVGYVHGTSTIAAILLLNLPTPSASFQALSNILNRPLTLSFHTNDSSGTSRAYNLLLSTLSNKSPRLHALLTNPTFALQPDIYLRDLFQGMFTGCLSLDNATRLWDVLVFEGDALLVRAGVAYLNALEGKLLGAQSANEVCAIVKGGLAASVGEEEWMKGLRSAGKSSP
ncbi:putative TBC1 domain family member 12 [Glarea lozoyensis 74030]|uniref:Putative TBC1 domain family member 12 n=1 Tax=Glarea lozoyensis (strain ATCC 74030 / MF5533) TaxID=1104152 RepID=H0EHR0_GLAL7|nr:putative TBC1 domain family member 12 [Glarea lozoyensis 74030]